MRISFLVFGQLMAIAALASGGGSPKAADPAPLAGTYEFASGDTNNMFCNHRRVEVRVRPAQGDEPKGLTFEYVPAGDTRASTLFKGINGPSRGDGDHPLQNFI